MKRLPVIETIKETVLVVWQTRLRLFRALIVTSLAMAALQVAQSHLLKDFRSLSVLSMSLMYLLLSCGLSTLFAVNCHRIILLGKTSVPQYGLFSWTSRETRFVGWTIVASLYALMVVGPLLLITYGVLRVTGPNFKAYGGYWTLACLIPGAYIFARLAVLLPATAVGERRNTDWAFATTAKNGWRLVLVMGLPTAIFVLANLVLPLRYSVLADFLVSLVGFAFEATGIAALSVCFRFLSSGAPENASLSNDS